MLNIENFLKVSQEYLLKTQEELISENIKERALNILLIEDDDFFIKAISRQLNDFEPPIQMEVAKNISDILNILGQHKHFDYVLLDGHLKDGENTIDISKEITQRYFTVSTSGDMNMQDKHIKNGAKIRLEKIQIINFLKRLHKDKYGKK